MVKQAIVALAVVTATQAQAGVCSATNGVVTISPNCKGNIHDQLLQAVKQQNKQEHPQGNVTVRGVFDSLDNKPVTPLGNIWSKR